MAMANESMMAAPPRSSLAPGFRFHPSDEELVRYYLRRKVCGKPFRFQSVTEIDVYKSEPWQLPEYSQLNTRDREWYFFSPVDKKYGSGSRLNRATGRGYWKATGKDRAVLHRGQSIGSKKTLVFHAGRSPEGQRTNWVMHEYRLSDQELEGTQVAQDAFVLCRIFQKSRLGPPTGERCAPFIAEEWEEEEDGDVFVPGGEADDDDDTTNGWDGSRNDTAKMETQSMDTVRKRVRSEGEDNNSQFEEPEHETELSLLYKISKQGDSNSTKANGSDDSATAKEAHPLAASPPSFDSSTLEKSVPPGFLKFINNLETKIQDLSSEKESLKMEVMENQSIINSLFSHIQHLTQENNQLKGGACLGSVRETKMVVDCNGHTVRCECTELNI